MPEKVGPLPESERLLYRVILGLHAAQPQYLLLPDTTSWDAQGADSRVDSLRRQLYWLFFELQHGQIFRYAPPQTIFFVAVPAARSASDSLGGEEKLFRRYLEERVGWSKQHIAERIRFIEVPSEVPYARDVAQALGYDSRGRLVYALGLDCPDAYRQALERIVRQFPDEFDLRKFPGISTEGGDLDFARLPNGRVALLVGRNRIRRYIESRGGLLDHRPLKTEEIEEARQAFARAFGVETIIVGEEALRRPELANDDLFHLDMVLAVFHGANGVVAFVPTYTGAPVDALTHIHLPPAQVSRVEAEYDRTAAQMRSLGYRVVRLPFADHPVRSPVNVGKFTDPGSRRQFVLLGRYPYHLELSNGHNPQTALQQLFLRFDEVVATWRRSRTTPDWKRVEATLHEVWQELDRAVESPNPLFEEQRRIYESNGVKVSPIPIYPTGEGGIHCLVLE